MTPEEIKIACCMYPDGYAKFRLGLNLHPTHIKVLNALFDKKNSPTKVSFRAANNVGKTSSVSLVAILYSIEILGADVIYTSSSSNQVNNQMIPRLKDISHMFPKNWEFQDRAIKINGISKLVAFATRDGIARFQGFHGTPEKPLVIIIDEAATVEEDIYIAAGKCFPTYQLVMGSPVGPSGVFYNIETKPEMANQYKHFKLTQHECLDTDGYWIKIKDINDYIDQWQSYGWVVPSTIYAEFSSTIENGLISLEELTKCYNYPPVEMGADMHVGIDVSAGGGDFNVISIRIGNKIDIIDVWREPEIMKSCDRIATHLNNLRDKYNINQNQVSLDADGIGIGFISRLKDLRWNVNEYHGGKTPDSPEFASNIAQIWLQGTQKIKKCSVILPDNEEFKLQLLSRKTMKNMKGKLQLESKADMKSRGVHSPDIADSIFIAMSNPNPGAVQYAHSNLKVPIKQYVGYF